VLRLHKVNGVIIEVPSEKMSVEDMCYVEKIAGQGSSHLHKADNDDDDDDEPLGNQRKSHQSATQQKALPINCFEFF
jgi:actin cytoskeleton-regulatory complex protein SLA1